MLLKQVKGIVLLPHFLLAFPPFLPARRMDNTELIWALHGSQGTVPRVDGSGTGGHRACR